MTPESALALISAAEDKQDPIALQNEVSGSRVRPTVLAYRADSVSPTKEVREPVTYRDPITSDSWAAVSSRDPKTWEDR